ncbi:M24 family metallopeptidase [Candidatus Saganbacteria bacterium]|nr:M24 family metallopeptidase [Candidatus Saganbacteria bacterium]
MNHSQQTAITVASQIMSRLKIHAGETEIAVAKRILRQLKAHDCHPAFRIIVASGRRAALPHGYATNKKIKKGELVMVDFGALYKGFCSDLTRTFVIGKPRPRQKRIFKIVKTAQRRAIKLVRAGVLCRKVDAAARDYIKDKLFGHCFIHTTGHGVGRKIHQRPKISLHNWRPLESGMVITIEPGIYIKGWGGVRIEDMVLVKPRGYELLTKAPIHLHGSRS